MSHKFPYKWYLKDGYPAKGIKPHGLKVFGTFICGGGSSMGYKLAGFDHIGGVEIDVKVAEVYKANHHPKHLYNMDIRNFNNLENLPPELFDLDILDGSPPCSTFSMAGSREKAWGKKKKFREGQAKQTLDDLVFVYLETIEKLRPKVALLENVKGLMIGNAKGYLKEIYRRFTKIGYRVQVFLLNASLMGVPQHRERVFIIGLRNDFDFPKLKLEFNEKLILFKEISDIDYNKDLIPSELSIKYWNKCKQGKSLSSVHPTGSWYNNVKLSMEKVSPTLMGDGKFKLLHPEQIRRLNLKEWCKIGTYPLDYNFKNVCGEYLIGMSVPPVMTAQIANQIYVHWLSRLES